LNVNCWVLIIFSSLLLIACRPSEDKSLNRYIQTIKKRPSKSIEPLPVFKPPPKLAHSQENQPSSPFEPSAVETPLHTTARISEQSLLEYPLDSFMFVGVLKQGTNILALVRVPGGLVFGVKQDDSLGMHSGKIIRINDRSLVVMEILKSEGLIKNKLTKLALHQRRELQKTPLSPDDLMRHS